MVRCTDRIAGVEIVVDERHPSYSKECDRDRPCICNNVIGHQNGGIQWSSRLLERQTHSRQTSPSLSAGYPLIFLRNSILKSRSMLTLLSPRPGHRFQIGWRVVQSYEAEATQLCPRDDRSPIHAYTNARCQLSPRKGLRQRSTHKRALCDLVDRSNFSNSSGLGRPRRPASHYSAGRQWQTEPRTGTPVKASVLFERHYHLHLQRWRL